MVFGVSIRRIASPVSVQRATIVLYIGPLMGLGVAVLQKVSPPMDFAFAGLILISPHVD
jgi:hypothetical protein